MLPVGPAFAVKKATFPESRSHLSRVRLNRHVWNPNFLGRHHLDLHTMLGVRSHEPAYSVLQWEHPCGHPRREIRGSSRCRREQYVIAPYSSSIFQITEGPRARCSAPDLPIVRASHCAATRPPASMCVSFCSASFLWFAAASSDVSPANSGRTFLFVVLIATERTLR